jgi:hypothetical protein
MNDNLPRGLTPNELARLLRVSPDRVRRWIALGQLGAIDVSDRRCGRPRFVILPHHLLDFEKQRSASPPPKTPRRRKPALRANYFSDLPDGPEGGQR